MVLQNPAHQGFREEGSCITLLFTMNRCCSILPLLALVVAAQTTGGAIRGAVTDPSGALVGGAEILIEEIATGETWRLASSGRGLYSAPNLPVGSYKLTVKAKGFETYEQTGILLNTN